MDIKVESRGFYAEGVGLRKKLTQSNINQIS